MAALTITPGDVSVVEWGQKHTGFAGEAIDAGEAVRIAQADGEIELANSGVGGGDVGGQNWISTKTANAAGVPLTIAGPGSLVYLGAALDGLSYDDPVYLNDADGAIGDAAGTVSEIVGYVEPLYGFGGGAAKKALRLV